MEITATQVKELREITGIGMMECKKALEEAKGDIDEAIEILRKKGLAKAAKKSDRETFEGGIKVLLDGKNAYIVSVACETDFLANSDKYKEMLERTAQYLKSNGETSKEAAQEMINSQYGLEMGENLVLKNYKMIDGGALAAYTHSNGKLASLVVAKEGTDIEKLKQLAMHVVAANPEYLKVSDISNDVVEKEKMIQLEIMKNDAAMGNKPEEVLLKIIEGKLSKFKSEITLLEQAFVINPDIKVKDFIGADTLTAFYRFSV